MKRKSRVWYEYGIYKHYNLFSWKKCDCCGDEFRREIGFTFLTGPFHGGKGVWRYLCKSCTPTIEIANDYAVNGGWMPTCPPPPPPPPPKKCK